MAIGSDDTIGVMKRFKEILCVVQADQAGEPALERAVSLAVSNQANLTVVDIVPHVTTGIGMPDGGPVSASLQDALVASHEQALEQLVGPYRGQTGIETRVLIGTPFLEIVHDVLRNGRDLVIRLAEQHDWLDRVFGGDDMHLLRKCPCPVWLIKSGAPKAFRRILAAVDVGDGYPEREMESRQALNRQILEMASSLALADFAELHIVHTWDAIGEGILRQGVFISAPENEINAYVEKTRRHHADCLNSLLAEVARGTVKDALDYLEPESHLVKGPARREIPALASRIGADLVVMGTVVRTGVSGFIMGNTAETILGQIDCSVLAIKPPGFVTPVRLD
jgi:nucleotide-binding universal stress UspA family protein